jgi:hypothetical protein
MRARPDYEKHSEEGDASPNDKPETHTACPDQVGRETKPGAKPFTGGYYWFPTPGPDGITWSVVTCRDLGCGRDAGHDADLWPRLMVPLAAAWGQDAQILKRRLALSYTGLPRGRVTRFDKTFLVLHGEDTPVQGFEEIVVASFRLTGRAVKFIFDEHETRISGHAQALAQLPQLGQS